MALFLTIVLVASSVALAALLWAKHWEMTTGRMLFSSKRPVLSDLSHRSFLMMQKHLPEAGRGVLERIAHEVRYGTKAAGARALLAIETWLEKTLHGLRKTSESKGESSSFLREIAEHKRQLAARVEEDTTR